MRFSTFVIFLLWIPRFLYAQTLVPAGFEAPSLPGPAVPVSAAGAVDFGAGPDASGLIPSLTPLSLLVAPILSTVKPVQTPGSEIVSPTVGTIPGVVRMSATPEGRKLLRDGPRLFDAQINHAEDPSAEPVETGRQDPLGGPLLSRNPAPVTAERPAVAPPARRSERGAVISERVWTIAAISLLGLVFGGLLIGGIVSLIHGEAGLGLVLVALAAAFALYVGKEHREQRMPPRVPPPASGPPATLPPPGPARTEIGALRQQLTFVLDELIEVRLKWRDPGEILRQVVEKERGIRARGGLIVGTPGGPVWVAVDPALFEAMELESSLRLILNHSSSRDQFLDDADEYFRGLRAEIERAKDRDDLLKRLAWWPAHFRQFYGR